MELQRIAEEKRALEEKRERERQMVRAAAMGGSGRGVVRPPIVEPKPFAFSTDARLGPAQVAPRGAEFKSTAEVASIILSRDVRIVGTSIAVVPGPSAAALNASLLSAASGSVVGSVSASGVGAHAASTAKMHLVEPRSPEFATARRAAMRPPTAVKTSEEMELEEIARVRAARAEVERRNAALFVAAQAGPLGMGAPTPASSARARAPHQPAYVAAPAPPQQEPFHLESLERHERAQQELRLKVEREMWEAEQRRQFHPRPVPAFVGSVVSAAAATPASSSVASSSRGGGGGGRMRADSMGSVPSSRGGGAAPAMMATPQLVDPKPFRLMTDERASVWQQLEAERREQEALRAAAEAREREERARREQEELLEYRRSLVHQPLPVPRSVLLPNAVEFEHAEGGGGDIPPECVDPYYYAPPAVAAARSSVSQPQPLLQSSSLSSSSRGVGSGLFGSAARVAAVASAVAVPAPEQYGDASEA